MVYVNVGHCMEVDARAVLRTCDGACRAWLDKKVRRGALDGEGQSESSLSVSRWQNLFHWTNDVMLEPKSESESSGGIRLGVNCKGTDERQSADEVARLRVSSDPSSVLPR